MLFYQPMRQYAVVKEIIDTFSGRKILVREIERDLTFNQARNLIIDCQEREERVQHMEYNWYIHMPKP